jgi:energy-coupling factor transporter ATP-binding protein EcfA2
MARAVEPEVARARWRDVKPEVMSLWDQGQHAVILGRTGSGKSVLQIELCEARAEERGGSVCLIGTKARDPTLRATGYPIIRNWPPTYAQRQGRRVILWPPYGTASTMRQTVRPRIVRAFDEMMEESAWTIGVDELSRLGEQLGLNHLLNEFWQGGRSSDMTLVGATQRPAWIARSSLSETSWVACFHLGDADDRLRAGEVLGDKRRWFDTIGGLGRHEFLLVHTPSGEGVVTKVGT